MAKAKKNEIKTEYIPIGSSYNISANHLNFVQEIGLNAVSSNNLYIYTTNNMYHAELAYNYKNNFDITIQNNSAGEIFNVYEKMILNSQWDCRDNGDYQTILLGREYMFYNVDGKIISYNTVNNVKINQEITFKPIYQNPLSFFTYINEQLVSNNITNSYDQGSTIKLHNGSKVNTDNNLEKMLNRDKCRKFSENHFAISGFNLITHSISINSQVCNTVSELIEDDEKNTISILGDLYEDKYIVELNATPIFPAASMSENEEFEHRSDEFLANKLLEELRYCYQGSIIIKFNPNIEIGDTITLMDNVSSTYGVFQVDSYEHSLDQRGLITSLVVRSSWTPKDPFLDYHSTTIGYKLIEDLKDTFNLDNSDETDNKQIHYIMSLYLKYIVQTPKYCVFYKKKKKGFFNPSTIKDNNVTAPTALPLRFFPMMIKGKAQIPKSIEPAFVAGKVEINSINSILDNITSEITTQLKDFAKGVTKATIKTFYFIADMLISTVTFNMSELIKPLLGMTADKAIKHTYDEIKKINSDDALNMLQYNPYEKKYKLMYNNFDFVFGFFNVRLQKEDDLYAANKLLERNSLNNSTLLGRKLNTVKKLMNDVFDVLFLVEVYDNFYTNISENKTYNSNDFLNDCESFNTSVDFKEKIYSNRYNNEYGVALKKSTIDKLNYKIIPLAEDGRNAIEVTIDVSSFKLNEYMILTETESKNVAFDVKQKGNIHIKKYLEEIKIVFFHNLYGDNKFDKGENSLETRRKNVRELLEKYEQYCNSKTTGVIIMADFNLNVYNKGELPYKENKNYNYELPNNNFIAKIKTATTLNQYGYLKGNQYDNVLLSKNINGVITAKVFEYPEKDKLTISDHVPVYIGIKKEQD